MKLTPISELYDIAKMSIVDLHEIYDRLLYEYRTPAEELDKKSRDFIRLQCNQVAAQIKIEAEILGNPKQEVLLLEPIKDIQLDEYGPELKKKIYVDTLPPLKPKTPAKAKAKLFVDEDLMGDTDDDLLGDMPAVKSKKEKSSVKPTVKTTNTKSAAPAKGTYALISELAAKGLDRDAIEKKTGLPRKTITDNLWRYNKSITKK